MARWLKLDHDFWHDRKFVALLSKKGEAAGFKVIKLYCLIDEEGGALDMADPSIRYWVEAEMNLKGRRLDDFIETCIDYDIFRRDAWETFGKLTNDRLMRANEKRREISEKRREAGKASGEARRASGEKDE